MAKSSNQKLKLLYIKKYLEENTDDEHFATVDDIIEELGRYDISAERKSIYNDIELLEQYGVDVEKKRTKSFGYYIANRDFELPELKLLVDAVQSSKFITEKKSKALIGKIEKLTSKNLAKKLDRQVNVADRIKTMNESIYYTVDDIHNAISQNKKISFTYFDWNEKKEKVYRHNGEAYSVSPYMLVWNDDNYYLIGYDDRTKENRHYRVDRMSDIAIRKADRVNLSGDLDEEMLAYSKKLFGMFSGKEEKVTLRCKNKFAGAMIDRFGKNVTFRRKRGSEDFEFSVNVVVSPTFFSWITTFEGDLQIVSPEKTKEEYRKFLEKVIGK